MEEVEKLVIIDSANGPRRVGKTNWTKIRGDMRLGIEPVIDDDCPIFTSNANSSTQTKTTPKT